MQRFNGPVTDVHTEMENQHERVCFICRYKQADVWYEEIEKTKTEIECIQHSLDSHDCVVCLKSSVTYNTNRRVLYF